MCGVKKPVVWMPRRLSDATIERARQDYEVILNEEDTPGTADGIIAMSAKGDAMIPVTLNTSQLRSLHRLTRD